MNYVSSFCQNYFLPQTSSASPLAHGADHAAANAVLDARIGTPGRSQTLVELQAIANEYGLMTSYDGLHTFGRAVAFLGGLPADIKRPDVSVDPDGEISFEWANASAALSVSIGPSGRLIYATNVQNFPTSGESFFGGVIPEDVLGPLLHFR